MSGSGQTRIAGARGAKRLLETRSHRSPQLESPCAAGSGTPIPLETLDDALRTENVVDLIVMGPASDCANWFERDLVAHARQRYEIPLTVLPGSVGAPCPWREAGRWGGRATIVLALGVVLALVLALTGAGQTWLIGELALVLGIVAVDIAAHLAIVGGLAWLAVGPLASRRSARSNGKTDSPL